MKIGVKVMPRKEILDTQGRAVEGILKQHGQKLDHCTVGKYIVLDIPGNDSNAAMAAAKSMAETVLYNPLIETFELEQL